MDKLLTKQEINVFKNKYKLTTQNKMKSHINCLLKEIEIKHIGDLLNDLPSLFNYANSKNTAPSKYQVLDTVECIMNICNCNVPEAFHKQKQVLKEAKEKHELDIRSKKTISAHTPEDILDFLLEHSDLRGQLGTYGILLFYLLSDVPMRLTEFVDLYNEPNEEFNYIDYDEGVIVLKHHKNDKSGKIRYVKLKEDTIDILKKQRDGEKVFPLTYRNIQDLFKSVVRKYKTENGIEETISISGFRRQFEENNLEKLDNGKCDNDAMKEILNNCEQQLGHQLGTAITTYTAPAVQKNEVKTIIKIYDIKFIDSVPDELLIKYSNGDWNTVKYNSLTPAEIWNLMGELQQFNNVKVI